MNKKVCELLNLTQKLLDQSKGIIEPMDAKADRYSIFLWVQMGEALKFGYGAYHSCHQRWGHGGIGAARSIYEILLDIKYINQDEMHREERVTRFMDHGDEYLYLKMERDLQIGATISQKYQDERTNAYDQLKKKYNDKHNRDIKSGIIKAEATPRYRKYNWAGIDLTQKVEVVDQKQFHQLYKELAELSHVSMGAVINAFAKSTKNQLVGDLDLHPSSVHCFSVLTVVFVCIAGILEEYMAHFEIEHSCYPNLEELWKDYKKLLQ